MFERAPLTAVKVRTDEVPAGDLWLGPHERTAQGRYRVGRRAAEWRMGRWAAKSAVARRVGVRPADIEILAGASGAPEAWFEGSRLPVNVSISHRDGRAIAVTTARDVEPGCDVELIEPRPAGFVEDWFTPRERAAIDQAVPAERNELITLIWSAKESVLKALHAGLQVDTRRVEVAPGRDGFDAVVNGRRIHGWWKRDGRFLITAAALERTQ